MSIVYGGRFGESKDRSMVHADTGTVLRALHESRGIWESSILIQALGVWERQNAAAIDIGGAATMVMHPELSKRVADAWYKVRLAETQNQPFAFDYGF